MCSNVQSFSAGPHRRPSGRRNPEDGQVKKEGRDFYVVEGEPSDREAALDIKGKEHG